MNLGIDIILANLGTDIQWVVLLLLVVGSLVFMAKSFQLGIMLLFLSLGVAFVALYETGNNFGIVLTTFFMCFVIMTFTLYASSKKAEQGGFI